MSAPRALFIGGTGIISSEAARLAIQRGWDLTLLNRGRDTTRPAAPGASVLVGDASDPASIAAAVGDREFDAVVNFRSFLPEQAASDAAFFAGRTAQYVYISSASAYRKPIARLPIRESTPLSNPFWEYSRNKIASEEVLTHAWRETGFPVTIVRPSHTYDATSLPVDGGWTVIDRMRRGLPVIVHGDGTSLWTLTHSRDFAHWFVPLLGDPAAIGDVFHITSDEAIPWDEIYRTLGRAAGVEPELVHVASDTIARARPDWGPGILGDKAHSVVFDNTKVRSIAREAFVPTPFWRGAREIIDWYDADAARRHVDPAVDAALDRLVAAHSG